MKGIDNLVICGPYAEPDRHWRYDRARREFDLVRERRPAGFLVASANSQSFDDPGRFVPLDAVNRIRDRVRAWRESGYPHVTGITKSLLEFWHNGDARENRLFFCQLEAIETLIWMVEVPEAQRQGLGLVQDGGEFERLCCKMATGTGKTVVMGMLVAWQVINKVTYPQDVRFSRHILTMAPGLTVKSRLQVLLPDAKDNIYAEFDLVPESLYQKLRKGHVAVHNWHKLVPEQDAPKSIVKLGNESPAAFSSRILDHDYDRIVVINDEAHHAYRAGQAKGVSKSNLDQDRKWMEGLDIIHRARTVVRCFDFSATPFVPSGRAAIESALFGWVVSDFSLNDAIESGLTKTPKIVVKDDARQFDEEYRSRFYHIYMDREVNADIKRKAKLEEPLPDLIHNAYMLLGKDWDQRRRVWEKSGSPVPPVMITVCNRTETAARVMHSFQNGRFEVGGMSDPEHIVHIDTNALKKAERSAGDKAAEHLRRKVNTVGKRGEPGERVRNVIAVEMLTEGWDAKNVTHIMGLRAFTSQLLCEQVVGRGLRRTSYVVDPATGLLPTEHVNVFGVPFTFLPHEESGGGGPPPPPTTLIEPDPDKAEHEISWPNVERIDVVFSHVLRADWRSARPLELSSDKTATIASVAPVIAGQPAVSGMSDLDLRNLYEDLRMQRVMFMTARDIYDSIGEGWNGGQALLLAQLVGLVEEYMSRGLVSVPDAHGDPLRTRMTMIFNMKKIAAELERIIKTDSTDKKELVLGQVRRKSTADMRRWYTPKPAIRASKCHANLAVYDSSWEAGAGEEMERSDHVTSWARNFKIGFVIKYLYRGVMHDYYPDFLVRLVNGVTLILEIKGRDDDQNRQKRESLQEWVETVNESGAYGAWACDVAFSPGDVGAILKKHATSSASSRERAKCPRCLKTARTRQEVESAFGFRNAGGIARPQSWCRDCRAGQPVGSAG